MKFRESYKFEKNDEEEEEYIPLMEARMLPLKRRKKSSMNLTRASRLLISQLIRVTN